ncbi:MAG: hypothetical protein O6913_03265 [Chloroflexi bacterium]|nr:hypothetical protein [Chloroflexota bacterium]
MSDLLQRIAALLQGDAAADPAAPALALLNDAGLLRQALTDSDAVIEQASAGFRGRQRRLFNLAARFEEADRSALHRTSLDPRGVAATATSAYIQRAGIYLPTELQALRDQDRIDRAWHARESLRLSVFLLLSGPLVDQLDQGEIEPDDYARRMRALAERVAQASIEASDV